MQISIVVAVDAVAMGGGINKMRGIGHKGNLPWPKLQNDMARFRAITRGGTVIMGRKTFKSLGAPLEGRQNVVMTTDRSQYAEIERQGGVPASNIMTALAASCYTNNIFVIGGASVYKEFLKLPETKLVYLTEVGRHDGKAFEADTFFPHIELIAPAFDWKSVDEEQKKWVKRFPLDETSELGTTFHVLRRYTEQDWDDSLDALANFVKA